MGDTCKYEQFLWTHCIILQTQLLPRDFNDRALCSECCSALIQPYSTHFNFNKDQVIYYYGVRPFPACL